MLKPGKWHTEFTEVEGIGACPILMFLQDTFIVCVETFFKTSSFVFGRRQKSMQVCK